MLKVCIAGTSSLVHMYDKYPKDIVRLKKEYKENGKNTKRVGEVRCTCKEKQH